MKPPIVLAFAFLATLAPAQDPAQRITFEARASRTDRLLSELSKAANVRLEASPQTANEVLVVSVKDVPVADLMKRIAVATSGEWRPEGTGFRLVANNAMRTQEARAELAARAQAIRKDLAAKLDPPKETASPGAASAPRSPSRDDKAIETILGSIDPTILAGVDSGERLVFSTAPTRMQRPMPAKAPAALAQLIREHNAQLPKAQERNIQTEASGALDQMPEFVKRMVNQRTRPITNPSKSLLIVSRMPFVGTTQAKLVIYDPTGAAIYEGQTTIGTSDWAQFMPGTTPKSDATNAAAATPIEFSEDSKALLEALPKMGQGNLSFTLNLPPALRAKLFRPDEVDPLAYMPTDAVLAVAKKQGKPLVANLPDSMVSLMQSFSGGGPKTVEGVEQDLKGAKEAALVEDPSWLVVRPARPAEARGMRLDRLALRALMQAAATKGVPTLDDVAAYALRAPSPISGGVGQVYATLFVPGVIQQSLGGMTDWEMLRIYGSLSQSQRQSLIQGGRIPLRLLPPGPTNRLLYGPMANFDVERPGQKKDDTPAMIAMFAAGQQDFLNEPTEVLGNGIPADAYLQLEGRDEPFASPVSGEGEAVGAAATLGAEEIALLRFFGEQPGMEAAAAFMPKLDRVKVGRRKAYQFRFRLTPAVSLNRGLFDNSLPLNAKVVSMKELPAEFQQLIQAKLEEIKKSPMGALGRMMGSQARPPKP